MIYKSITIIIICFLSSSCGYHFSNQRNIPLTIAIPYIEGDRDGSLTNILIQKITDLGCFTPVSGNGDFLIQAQVRSDVVDAIGFQFDPKCLNYKKDKRVIANENRRTIEVKFSIFSGKTQKKLFGPYFIKEYIDYDFLDEYVYIDSSQNQQSSLHFSLGQLDNKKGSFSSCLSPLFHKITESMSRVIFCVLHLPVVTLDEN